MNTIDSIISALADKTDGLVFVGDKNHEVSGLVRLEEVLLKTDAAGDIIFINEKAIKDETAFEKLRAINTGLVITTENIYNSVKNDGSNYILTDSPRTVFNEVIKHLFKDEIVSKIEDSARVAETVQIGANCYIGHGVVLEDNVIIGDNTEILHNTILRKNTRIGNNVCIGCNNTIGSRGFGYVKNDAGDFERILHVGNVVIEDDVEIHNNTCIDRAVIGSTIIKKGAKIDNLVHISHGVEIGENSVVIANSMIGGSSKIGDAAWIAPSVSVINKVEIGKNSLLGMGSVVTKNTPDDFKGFGNPIRGLGDQKKWSQIQNDLMNKQQSE